MNGQIKVNNMCFSSHPQIYIILGGFFAKLSFFSAFPVRYKLRLTPQIYCKTILLLITNEHLQPLVGGLYLLLFLELLFQPPIFRSLIFLRIYTRRLIS